IACTSLRTASLTAGSHPATANRFRAESTCFKNYSQLTVPIGTSSFFRSGTGDHWFAVRLRHRKIVTSVTVWNKETLRNSDQQANLLTQSDNIEVWLSSQLFDFGSEHCFAGDLPLAIETPTWHHCGVTNLTATTVSCHNYQVSDS
uniref:SRCR domain-containing protein n=1 Tax=Macrostomum lignano TaxID=282301 RepID=A0A1I8JIY5_9PLAT